MRHDRRRQKGSVECTTELYVRRGPRLDPKRVFHCKERLDGLQSRACVVLPVPESVVASEQCDALVDGDSLQSCVRSLQSAQRNSLPRPASGGAQAVNHDTVPAADWGASDDCATNAVSEG